MSSLQTPLNVDSAVRDRYSAAAQEREEALCCPVSYNQEFLKIIPQEILERDYGCGDPSEHLKPGETVLDLGSGGGKLCYIASQVVGPEGKVIGVDCNDEMLGLARQYQPQIAETIGYSNVEFHKGRIQDLKLDLEVLEKWLDENPVSNSTGWLAAQEQADRLRATLPMIPDNSVDVVISNCVLNLVEAESRHTLFREIHRVLKKGGRAVISDIVSDEYVPDDLRNDPTLWSGCISGAFQESEFLEAFASVGLYGIEILKRQVEPWVTEKGIEFRSMTVQVFKGKEGPCLDGNQAVVYRGPWRSVIDDDGHELRRGERMAVCEKTFEIYSREPYASQMILLPPSKPVPAAETKPFDCHDGAVRDPKVTKFTEQMAATLNELPQVESCCGPDCC